MRVSILGKTWNLEFVPRRECGTDAIGSCDSPDMPRKTIRVASGLKGVDRLDTIIHESIHAAHFALDEAFVEQFASDLARILWRLGYRET